MSLLKIKNKGKRGVGVFSGGNGEGVVLFDIFILGVNFPKGFKFLATLNECTIMSRASECRAEIVSPAA